MIPRHRPPFGLRTLLSVGLRSLFPQSVESLERQYALKLGVSHAVWLPSARYGICRLLQSFLPGDAPVYCPAFTCAVVHDAVQRSGRRLRLTDCGPNSFLMDPHVVYDQTESHHAVVLSEIYGYRFSQDLLASPMIESAQLRIYDMAMAIPEPSDVQRLTNRDVALLSFGLGKSLFAGWGGIALMQDSAVADDLRTCRDQDLQPRRRLENLRANGETVLRTAAHTPVAYGWLRSLKTRTTRQSQAVSTPEGSEEFSPREYCRQPSSMNVALTCRNLARSDEFAAKRRELAERLQAELAAKADRRITLPPQTNAALSHYTIQVPAESRESFRQHLWSRGIDSALLFPLTAATAGRSTHTPIAHRLTTQIVNLPLAIQMTNNDVSTIADVVAEYRFESSCDGPQSERRAA